MPQQSGQREGATKEIHRSGTSGQVGAGHGVSLQAKGKKWDCDKAAEEVRGKAQTRRKAQVAQRCRCQKQHVLQVLGYRALGRTQTGR